MRIHLVFNRLLSFTGKVSFSRAMSVFIQQPNPVTGKMDWILQDEKYDYHQEIARSAYTDMLHDTERNQKYYAGLRKAVAAVKQRGKAANVLDIGTGTGLLSMMAASAGADTVTACEAFEPMANCAKKIMKQNKFGEKIKLVPKRSTEMTAGEGGDMSQRANILVTEVFDTELIGEGAVGTYNHAHEHLLEDDCMVIPRAATVYAQPVCSEFVRRWNQIDTSRSGIKLPSSVATCGGAPSLHDIQLDQIPASQFVALANPVPVFRFDFSSKKGLEKERRKDDILQAAADGQVDAIFMWWDLEMDYEGEITLSCAPRWAHPDGNNLPWRDHWMQAVYYPSSPLPVSAGQSFQLTSCHDEYSLWFDVCLAGDTSFHISEERPVCTCGFHTTLSRTRIGMMGDPKRVDRLQTVIKQHVSASSVCLCVCDGSLLPVMVAQAGAKKVFVLESNPMCKKITETLVKCNELTNQVVILDTPTEEITSATLDNLKIDVVLSEPFFVSSLLPWQHIYMWYTVRELSPFLAADAKVLPGKLVIWAVLVDFDHLWKIRAPVMNCEGFDLAEFDSLIEASSDIADNNVEPQPLWEYPGTALSHPVAVLKLEYDDIEKQTTETKSSIKMEMSGQLSGVALWAEYEFEDDNSISSGPREHVKVGETIQWDWYTRQGVHLFKSPRKSREGETITVDVKFNPDIGDVAFSFH